MTNLSEKASILNFSVRSLFTIVDSQCTDANCTNSARDDEISQIEALEQAQKECNETIEKRMQIDAILAKQNYCTTVWDGAACWPTTPAASIQTNRCPRYVVNLIYEANATKKCSSNGSWQNWTDYTQCSMNDNFKYYLAEHLPNYYLITAVGYTVSLIALLAAYFIFTFNKRLRSPKNNLHMKLFLSFILRCVLFHIKRHNAFSDDIDLPASLNTSTNSTDLTSNNAMSNRPLACKLFTIIWQFSLLANYNFILMEAVYLQSLISFNTFNDNSSITKYVVFGWGIPAIIVIPWSLAKYYFENNECWTTIDNTYIFWIIKGPITLSIILSFTIFINVIRILYLKIFSSGLPNQINSKYSKWFRSTLVLLPLFGAHFTVILICKALTFNTQIEIILFYFDLIFTSFQGFFVALLYCFFSSEVLTEVKKSWRQFVIGRKTNKSLSHYPSNRKTSNTFNSVLTQSIKHQLDKQVDRTAKVSLPDSKSSCSNGNQISNLHAISRSNSNVITNHFEISNLKDSCILNNNRSGNASKDATLNGSSLKDEKSKTSNCVIEIVVKKLAHQTKELDPNQSNECPRIRKEE